MSASATEAVSSTSTRPALSFRPDIQGLRAVAVLTVILSHFRVPGFSGGYIGVDVFLVISGFLITGLLVKDVERRGRVSMSDFYARRARRILPAAFAVGLATLVAASVLLPLLRVKTITVDFLWSSLFAANIRFALVGTDYFAQGEPASPLRHYWSLAVEEQFYLVWPLLVLGWALWGGRRWRVLAVALGLGVLASLVWSVVATEQSPLTAYFSTLTRAWELGVGAAAALLLARTSWRPSRAQSLVLAWGGLAAIGWATWAFDASTPFPGTAALVPVLGSVALILAGAHGAAGSTPPGPGRLLTTRPMVVIGDWSYSLYLWHWPLVTIARQHFGIKHLGVHHVVVLVATTFLFSWLTYKYVETPFRHGRRWRAPRMSLAIYPATLVLAVIAAAGSTQWADSRLVTGGDEPAITAEEYSGEISLARDDYVALVQASTEAARRGRAVPSDLTPGLVGLRREVAPLGDCDYRTGTTDLCNLGDPEAERAIVVLGDSHARAWSPTFTEIGKERGYAVYVLVYSGCMANAFDQIERGTGHVWEACAAFKEWAVATIGEIDPELVVVATSGTTVVDPETGEMVGRRHDDKERYFSLLQAGYTRLLENVDAVADRVVMLANTPRLPRETGVCLSRGTPDLGDCAFSPVRGDSKVSQVTMRAARDAGAQVLDARPWFCDEGLCPAVVGSYITMRDKEHITPDYARWLADPVARALRLGEGDRPS